MPYADPHNLAPTDHPERFDRVVQLFSAAAHLGAFYQRIPNRYAAALFDRFVMRWGWATSQTLRIRPGAFQIAILIYLWLATGLVLAARGATTPGQGFVIGALGFVVFRALVKLTVWYAAVDSLDGVEVPSPDVRAYPLDSMVGAGRGHDDSGPAYSTGTTDPERNAQHEEFWRRYYAADAEDPRPNRARVEAFKYAITHKLPRYDITCPHSETGGDQWADLVSLVWALRGLYGTPTTPEARAAHWRVTLDRWCLFTPGQGLSTTALIEEILHPAVACAPSGITRLEWVFLAGDALRRAGWPTYESEQVAMICDLLDFDEAVTEVLEERAAAGEALNPDDPFGRQSQG